jgi:hypothetical protein
MDDVAPGILLEDDSRSIAKGLTSKTDRVLSKTSHTGIATDQLAVSLQEIPSNNAMEMGTIMRLVGHE